MEEMKSHSSKQYFLLILILGTLTALSPFSIDMYLPGFPAIAADLHTTTGQVALTLSSFFIGISAGQLLYGPLLDRFGRKKPLYIGLSVYLVTSLGCVFVRSVDVLIVLRFVQALGSRSAGVASVAMVRDLFPVNENAKVFALLMLVLGTSPMIAPTIGGYVTAAFGWQSVFIILASIALLIIIAVFFLLPGTYKPDLHMSLKPGPIISNFLMVIREPQFYTYALTGAVAFSGLFAYVSGSPLVFMEIFKVSGKVYGWIFAFLSIGLIGSSQVNSLLLRRFKSEQIVYAALISQVLIGLLFVTATSLGLLGLAGTIACIFLYMCCLGFTNPNTAALSMAPFSKNGGSASALMGAMQMALGSLASIAVSLFNSTTAMPMATIMASTTIIGFLVLLTGRRSIRSKVSVDLKASTSAGLH
jgi:DHA1 family bicyclomycin/chloramphenicol resistance-like MFS transporter